MQDAKLGRRLPVAAMAALVTALAWTAAAEAADLTIALESASTFDLQAVLFSAPGAEVWQNASLMGTAPQGPVVVAGGSGQFVVPDPAGTCVFDLQFVMDSDVTFRDDAVDLCNISTYRLTDMFE